MGANCNSKQQFEVATRLVGNGQQASNSGYDYAVAIAKAIGLNKDNVSDANIKKIDRIVEKANGRHNGKVGEVGDITRWRILFNHPSQILALRSLLGTPTRQSKFDKEWANHKITLTEKSDHFLSPKEHGYIGYDIKFTTDISKNRKPKCEIQFLHENMQNTDEFSHRIYEAIREIEDKATAEGRYPTKKQFAKMTDEERKAAQEGLTPQERESIAQYYQTNISLYRADMANYGLDILLGQDPKMHKRRRNDKKDEPSANVVNISFTPN